MENFKENWLNEKFNEELDKAMAESKKNMQQVLDALKVPEQKTLDEIIEEHIEK